MQENSEKLYEVEKATDLSEKNVYLFFFCQFVNNFSELLLCKVNFFDIVNVVFFGISILS